MGRARRARKIAATAAYGGGGLAAGIGALGAIGYGVLKVEAKVARRIVGQARTFLEFHSTDDLMSELPEHMERVQKAVSQASDAISRKYFNQADELAWVGEVS
jgi:hypothetical protein